MVVFSGHKKCAHGGMPGRCGAVRRRRTSLDFRELRFRKPGTSDYLRDMFAGSLVAYARHSASRIGSVPTLFSTKSTMPKPESLRT